MISEKKKKKEKDINGFDVFYGVETFDRFIYKVIYCIDCLQHFKVEITEEKK